MVRFGIAGFGLHAVKRLMPGFAKARNCRVTALCRRDPERDDDEQKEFMHSLHLYFPRMAESAGVAGRFANGFHGLPADLDDGTNDHLCYAVAGVQGLFFLA